MLITWLLMAVGLLAILLALFLIRGSRATTKAQEIKKTGAQQDGIFKDTKDAKNEVAPAPLPAPPSLPDSPPVASSATTSQTPEEPVLDVPQEEKATLTPEQIETLLTDLTVLQEHTKEVERRLSHAIAVIEGMENTQVALPALSRAKQARPFAR